MSSKNNTMSGLRQIATEPGNLDAIRASGEKMEKNEKSPRLKQKTKSQSDRVSDSEQSNETNSLSAESNNDNGRSPIKSTGHDYQHHSTKSKQRRRGAEWEIIDSMKVQYVDQLPEKMEGFLLKKRKWPLKGWHKVCLLSIYLYINHYKQNVKVSIDINLLLLLFLQRFFLLDKGNLSYAKRSADLARGKPHGQVDLGLSVISAKRRRGRIDIDAEVFIYHIKVRRNS